MSEERRVLEGDLLDARLQESIAMEALCDGAIQKSRGGRETRAERRRIGKAVIGSDSERSKVSGAALDSARQANVRLTKYYLRVKMIFLRLDFHFRS